MEASANFAVLNFLSFTVATFCFIMKVPQIWKIIQSGDTKGISLGSVLLEQGGYDIIFKSVSLVFVSSLAKFIVWL